jgi:hypothetical protein
MLEPAWHDPAEEIALRRAILLTLIYADIFDFPLTPSELCRYLIGLAAAPADVAAAVEHDPTLRGEVEQSAEWVYLAGRGHLVQARQARVAVSALLWPLARHYGAMIARLPFVRLVAVTGALSMNNARPQDDIDLFILVQPGRLWLCRLLVLGVVKLAARRGIELCPNFLLSTDHLRLASRNLYTAHEVAQLVPLNPGPWYQAFLDANQWVYEVLPNALAASTSQTSAGAAWLARVAGGMLSIPLVDPLERWEMRRKVQRLTARLEHEGGTVAFSAHECRGHFAAHDVQVLSAYRARVDDYRDVLI